MLIILILFVICTTESQLSLEPLSILHNLGESLIRPGGIIILPLKIINLLPSIPNFLRTHRFGIKIASLK